MARTLGAFVVVVLAAIVGAYAGEKIGNLAGISVPVGDELQRATDRLYWQLSCLIGAWCGGIIGAVTGATCFLVMVLGSRSLPQKKT